MNATAADYDIVIVGGGMVGASLGLALAGTPLRVAIVEPVLPGEGAQPSFDDRCTALANGSRSMLATLGAWPAIAPQATAIQTIHISDAGGFGSARLEASQLGLPALGYTVPNRAIGVALWAALRAHPRIELLAPAKVTAMEMSDASALLRLEMTGPTASAPVGVREIRARLVVAADGDRSLVRERAGLSAAAVDFAQVAIVANVSAERRAGNIAYERFSSAAGPLALLPRPDGHYTVVWTVAAAVAAALTGAEDAAFLAQLQQACGWRVGAFTSVGRRAGYPLLLRRAQQCTATRVVLVGNAAQSLHPVAGQGFNLGLRDAAVLAELVAVAGDPGDAAVLARYQQRRTRDREGMIGFTDSLVRLFALSFPAAASLRSLGLLLFDGSTLAKRGLSGVSWGFGEQTPRLLRGLSVA